MCVTNRALPYSMSNDILRIVLCRGLVRRVVSLPKESLGKLVTDFFKTFVLNVVCSNGIIANNNANVSVTLVIIMVMCGFVIICPV